MPPSRSDADVAARPRLRHVFCLGGGSGAGKTTIARRIAAGNGLRLYSTDDVMADHARRSTPREVPYLKRFEAMTMDERWVSRTPGDDTRQAVWLLSTPAFRRAAFDGREAGCDVPVATSDPRQARHNVLERDRLFTERLAAEAGRLGVQVIEVDVATSEDALAAEVRRALGLGDAPRESRVDTAMRD